MRWKLAVLSPPTAWAVDSPHVDFQPLSLLCVSLCPGALFQCYCYKCYCSSYLHKWFFNSRQNSLQNWCLKIVPFTKENHPRHTKVNRNASFIQKQNEILSQMISLHQYYLHKFPSKGQNPFVSELWSIKREMMKELNTFGYCACYPVHMCKRSSLLWNNVSKEESNSPHSEYSGSVFFSSLSLSKSSCFIGYYAYYYIYTFTGFDIQAVYTEFLFVSTSSTSKQKTPKA